MDGVQLASPAAPQIAALTAAEVMANMGVESSPNGLLESRQGESLPLPNSDELLQVLAEALPQVIKNLFNGVIRLFDHMAEVLAAGRQQPGANLAEGQSTAVGNESTGKAGFLDKALNTVNQVGTIWDRGKEVASNIWSDVSGFFSAGLDKAGSFLSNIPVLGNLLGAAL